MNRISKLDRQLNLLLAVSAIAGVTACSDTESVENSTANAAFDLSVSLTTTGPVPPAAVLEHDAYKAMVGQTSTTGATETIIPSVPAYIWRHGCGPTATGMVVGYYDANGFALIDGDASTQTNAVNQAIASGGDNASNPYPAGSEQHFEDYAAPLDGPALITDAYITAGRSAHANNSIADYMNTSRSSFGLAYGWSFSSYLASALVGYVHQKAPSVTVESSVYGGAAMTWEILTQEVNAHRPMVFVVDTDGDGATDHAITAIGYRETPTRQYASRDTWSQTVRWENFTPIASGTPWGVAAGVAFTLRAPIPNVTVQTGSAFQIGQDHARLGLTVTNNSGTSVECGVCWGPAGSGADFVTQVGANGVRCMRQIPCVGAPYFTNDGYMTQRPYVPGTTYDFKAYARNDTQITYGSLSTFSIPKVNTGDASNISTSSARLGVMVNNAAAGAVSECGVCWGATSTPINFVTQVGADGVRCMRQIPCRHAAYYTSDGYMTQRPYVPGTTYAYRGYSINDAGVAYGDTKYFTAAYQ